MRGMGFLRRQDDCSQTNIALLIPRSRLKSNTVNCASFGAAKAPRRAASRLAAWGFQRRHAVFKSGKTPVEVTDSRPHHDHHSSCVVAILAAVSLKPI